MKYAHKLFVLIVLALLWQHPAIAQWQQTNGPQGGTVRAFVASGPNLIIGAADGLYLSVNGDTAWTRPATGLPTAFISALAAASGSVFATVSGGDIYRSQDNGLSWTATGAPSLDLLHLTTSGDTLFATKNLEFVYQYIGGAWTVVASAAPSPQISSFVRSGGNFFLTRREFNAGTDGVSKFDGFSWTNQSNGLVGRSTFISKLLARGDTVFAATDSGVYRLDDPAGTWNSIGLDNRELRGLYFKGDSLYAGLNQGGVEQYLGGSVWTPVNTGFFNEPAFALPIVFCFAEQGGALFAGTFFSGVYRLSGGIWTARNTGFNRPRMTALGTKDGKIYSGTYFAGTSVSSDNGNTWSLEETGQPTRYLNCFAVLGDTLFSGSGGGAARFNGSTWTPFSDGLGFSNVYSLATKNDTMYAGGYESVYRYTGSNAFVAVGVALPVGFAYRLALKGDRLFAGSNGGGVFRLDNGVWVEKNVGLTGSFVYAIAVSGENLIAATNGGIFRSTNDGESWSRGSNSFASQALAVSGGLIFAGTSTGVLYSTDGGVSWANSTGLSVGSVVALTVAGGFLFAGVEEYGVWRIPLSDFPSPGWQPQVLTSSTFNGIAATASAAITVGDNGTIYKSTDGGATWQPAASSTTNALNDVALSDNFSAKGNAASGIEGFGSAVAVGVGGTILRSGDGGTSWQGITTSNTNTLNSVAVSSAFGTVAKGTQTSGTNGFGSAVAVGVGGTILRSTNGGDNWNSVNLGGSELRGVALPSDFTGTLASKGDGTNGTNGFGSAVAVGVGGTILRSANGGDSWGAVTSPTTNTLNAVSWFGNSSVASAAKGSSAQSINGFGSAVAVGVGGTILRSADGGQNWQSVTGVTSQDLFGVQLISETTGYLTGANGAIFKTTDGGATWFDQSIAGAGQINGIAVLPSGQGFAAGTGGTVFTTTSGGTALSTPQTSAATPRAFMLSQNYPNPFNPSTTISYSIALASSVRLVVYDVLGREVATLISAKQAAGNYRVNFNASNLSSGVYFYRLQSGANVQTRKMLLVK